MNDSNPEPWYSDEALVKQAAAEEKLARGEQLAFTDMAGIYAPRTAPTPEERCCCCGLDARDAVGGEELFGRRWCALCISREHPGPESQVSSLPGSTQ